MFLFLAVAVAIAVGVWAWWRDAIISVDAFQTTPKIFVVRRGEGVKSIAARLASDGLIRSPTGFYLLVKIMGIERSLQAGDYRLNAGMDAQSLLKN